LGEFGEDSEATGSSVMERKAVGLDISHSCVLRFFCIIYIIQNAFFVQLVFYTVLYIFIYFLWLDLDLDLDLVFFYSHVFYIYSLFVFYL
jgi:hypothetical protein